MPTGDIPGATACLTALGAPPYSFLLRWVYSMGPGKWLRESRKIGAVR